MFFPDFGWDDDDDDDGGGDETKTPKVGDYYSTAGGQGNRKFYYVLQSDGSFKKVGRNKPKTGNEFSKSDFNPVIENIKNNQNNNLDGKSGGGEDDIGGGETIDDNTTASLNFNVENQNKLNKIFNSETPIAMNIGGLEGGEKVTFIDMRKKINDSAQGGSGIDGANTELVDNIPEFDPSRSSIYEAFVSA